MALEECSKCGGVGCARCNGSGVKGRGESAPPESVARLAYRLLNDGEGELVAILPWLPSSQLRELSARATLILTDREERSKL